MPSDSELSQRERPEKCPNCGHAYHTGHCNKSDGFHPAGCSCFVREIEHVPEAPSKAKGIQGHERLELEWMAQTEWQDYRNWLEHELIKSREAERSALERAAQLVENHGQPHSACRGAIGDSTAPIAGSWFGHQADCEYAIAAEIRALSEPDQQKENMASELDDKWLASEYLDNGRYGVLTGGNSIVIGISVGLSKEQCQAIAEYHNKYVPEPDQQKEKGS